MGVIGSIAIHRGSSVLQTPVECPATKQCLSRLLSQNSSGLLLCKHLRQRREAFLFLQRHIPFLRMRCSLNIIESLMHALSLLLHLFYHLILEIQHCGQLKPLEPMPKCLSQTSAALQRIIPSSASWNQSRLPMLLISLKQTNLKMIRVNDSDAQLSRRFRKWGINMCKCYRPLMRWVACLLGF